MFYQRVNQHLAAAVRLLFAAAFCLHRKRVTAAAVMLMGALRLTVKLQTLKNCGLNKELKYAQTDRRS